MEVLLYIDILRRPSTQPQSPTVIVRYPALLPPIAPEKKKKRKKEHSVWPAQPPTPPFPPMQAQAPLSNTHFVSFPHCRNIRKSRPREAGCLSLPLRSQWSRQTSPSRCLSSLLLHRAHVCPGVVGAAAVPALGHAIRRYREKEPRDTSLKLRKLVRGRKRLIEQSPSLSH